ncbi:hypothetical protein [Pseudomonas nitroreducens]|uniref:hypothetical protein n=1 Tax=Pseudomonas nitroreducens TaxID=46680 RepID=UPI0026594306|nr:hypothetical protein [Pseudomonas nitroreducens]MCP1649318.1 hypothetical protein [Pseudomonas nitroreducens]MCP1684721.1 hypothetical protein [Pseudomonas nitroreducens]
MIPIQEIDVYSNNNIKISAHIIKSSSGDFTAEAVVYDPSHNDKYSSYFPLGVYCSAVEAFVAVVDSSANYICRAGGAISRIDNPCNAEFVSQPEQQHVINLRFPGIIVQLNSH